jgi:hypothetical protein
MPNPKPAQTNASILSSLPSGTTRVQVIDEFGKTRFKSPNDVADTDQIVIGSNGDPIVMSGRPGRKKKPDLAPANDRVAEQIRAKEIHVEGDDLLDTIRQNPESDGVLDRVMEGLAEEAASLSFERREAERTGTPTSQISMRRINALKAVGDSYLKRKEIMSSGGVDMDSPAFKKLFTYIMDTFRDALIGAGSRPEMVETVFANLSKRLDEDWHKEATKKMTES